MAAGRMTFTRQLGILDPKKMKRQRITVIGSGAVGSFAALSLAKMGTPHIDIYDNDGVSDHNLPNQFYRKQDTRKYKVLALKEILGDFSDAVVSSLPMKYVGGPLGNAVVVATDSMSSRKLVWDNFKRQPASTIFIEARMGAELGRVYTIVKKKEKLSAEDIKFYESRWYSDDKVKPLPCTARTIIYNVLMISSLICRAYKGVLMKEDVPREQIFNMTILDERSWMYTR
jgi:hypothetical protein